MAARGPTCALLHTQGVVGTTNEQLAPGDSLEMTFEAEIRIANAQQLGIDRPVRVVTNRATLASCFMLEHVGAALRRMATDATVIRGGQLGAATRVN